MNTGMNTGINRSHCQEWCDEYDKDNNDLCIKFCALDHRNNQLEYMEIINVNPFGIGNEMQLVGRIGI